MQFRQLTSATYKRELFTDESNFISFASSEKREHGWSVLRDRRCSGAWLKPEIALAQERMRDLGLSQL